MIRLVRSILAVAALVATPAAAATLQTTDLNGATVAIPAGLSVDRTVLMVAFRHKDQTLLDAWRDGLGLKDSDAGWLVTPVIPVTSPMIQPMILGGMKRTLATPAQRSHMAPVFADPKAVAAGLGIDVGDIAVLVLDRSGRVVASARGVYAPEKARGLAAALHPGG